MPKDGIPRPLGPRFRKAMVYAARLHAQQARKGTDQPYIGHLMGVAALVLRYGGVEDEAIAAMLHDAVEDQGGRATLDAIRGKFGERVARIVEGCTDSYATPKPAWRTRKQQYIDHARRASSEVVLVSAADKLYNVRDILFDYRLLGENLWERFTAGRAGVLWYYRALVTAFRGMLSSGPREELPLLRLLVDDLDRAVTELEVCVAGGGKKARG
jgi:(p)ppGpp synthase/HD superfamily hydrolase